MKFLKTILLVLVSTSIYAQTKNFIDLPYIETSAKVNTLVTPDKIYMTINIFEEDTKGKKSVEELEKKMANELKSLGIVLSKQLFVNDIASNFEKYFLRKQEVLKTKSYTLIVYDAKTAGQVLINLEKQNISNVRIQKTEFTGVDDLKLKLKSKAISKAKQNAIYLVKPLDQKVGKAIYISDVNNVINYYANQVANLQIRQKSESESYEPIDIDFQKIKIESKVDVKFILE